MSVLSVLIDEREVGGDIPHDERARAIGGGYGKHRANGEENEEGDGG